MNVKNFIDVTLVSLISITMTLLVCSPVMFAMDGAVIGSNGSSGMMIGLGSPSSIGLIPGSVINGHESSIPQIPDPWLSLQSMGTSHRGIMGIPDVLSNTSWSLGGGGQYDVVQSLTGISMLYGTLGGGGQYDIMQEITGIYVPGDGISSMAGGFASFFDYSPIPPFYGPKMAKQETLDALFITPPSAQLMSGGQIGHMLGMFSTPSMFTSSLAYPGSQELNWAAFRSVGWGSYFSLQPDPGNQELNWMVGRAVGWGTYW